MWLSRKDSPGILVFSRQILSGYLWQMHLIWGIKYEYESDAILHKDVLIALNAWLHLQQLIVTAADGYDNFTSRYAR